MSGREIGTIAGALIVGYLTAGTGLAAYGTAIGGVVGGAVGSLADPKIKTQGPRLDDLKVTVSTYGNAIPTVYGTARVGGNVFWSTDKLEIGTTQTAGKGGGSSNTTYKYYVHMAIALCYGPITGIRKIWQDGKLIYDVSSGASVGSALATADNPYANLIVYNGDEAQLPDPIIESLEGVGNVPAYRGIAYVRMIAVECPGGRIPQFSFEVSTSLSTTSAILPIATVPMSTSEGGLCTTEGAYHWTYSTASGAPIMSVYAVGSGYATPLFQSAYPSGLFSSYAPRPINGSKYEALRAYVLNSDTSTIHLQIVDLVSGSSKEWAAPLRTTFSALDRYGGTAYDPVSQQYAITSSNAINETIYVGAAGGPQTTIVGASAYLSSLAFYSGVIYALYCTNAVNGSMSFVAFDAVTGSTIYTIAAPTGTNWSTRAAGVQADASGIYIFINPYGVVTDSGCVYKLGGTSWTQLCSTVKLLGADGTSVSPTCHITNTGIVAGPYLDATYDLTLFASYSPVNVNVSDIISDQCTKAGLSSIDVSKIPDSVWGYTIASVSSARNNLQPLLTAFAIDAVDEDGALKFFKRAAITSQATVTYNELACVDGTSAPGDPLPLVHAQEADLPSSIAVSHLNPAFDYQTGTETWRRSTALTRNDQTIDLPLSCSPDFAASVAQMLGYDAWNERNRRTAQVSRKWAYLSAGDGVTIEYPQGTFQLWRLSKVTDTGTLMQWELVPADATIYTQQAIGSAQRPALQVPALAAPTNAQIIDGPILQDADNNAGLYVAMSGYGAPFPGAELLVGPAASSLVSAGTVTNDAPMGFAETVPGAAPSTSVDETSLLTVNMGRFALSSCTRDVLLAGATNLAAYGANGRWEYIAFRDVASLGSGRYTLAGFLRGQRGTEWASGLHQASDKFILLGLAGTLRPVLDVGSVGTAKLYRAITTGRSTGNDQTYASTAEGLKPFSPVNVRKSVDASNNVTLTWDRRTRLSQNWLMGIVPLGESGESYSVDFYTSSGFTTIAGTFTTSTPSLTLTAAQQTAIGLTPGATAYVNVYQVSSSIGRGHAAQATV